jgi:hypothetical protein
LKPFRTFKTLGVLLETLEMDAHSVNRTLSRNLLCWSTARLIADPGRGEGAAAGPDYDAGPAIQYQIVGAIFVVSLCHGKGTIANSTLTTYVLTIDVVWELDF